MSWTYRVILSLVLFCCFPAYGQSSRVLVAYDTPDSSQEPFYADVLQGIERKVGAIEKLEIPPGVSDLQAMFDRSQPDTVIALGNRAADLAYKTSYRNKAIAGLFPFTASEYSGVSLTLDNAAVATKLLRFIPSVQRLFFIQQHGFHTITDTVPAPAGHPKIVMVDGGDSLATIRLLSNLVEYEVSPSDAVFIPPNLPDDILFKIGLIAWDKNIRLFSTNMWHLENGAVMVFYPNAAALGEQLGAMTTKMLPAFETVNTIDVALNRRLAQHLGLVFEFSVKDLFAVKIK